jgi:hypothetical protein
VRHPVREDESTLIPRRISARGQILHIGSWTETPAKAADAIGDNEFELNEIGEREIQFGKHNEQRISTPLGMMVHLRAEEENANDLMGISRESFPKEIDQNETQFETDLE